VLVQPFSQDFLQLFLLPPFIRLLLFDIVDQVALKLASPIGHMPVFYPGPKHGHAKVMDRIAKNDKESLQLDFKPT
jgi:hypothetical protein